MLFHVLLLLRAEAVARDMMVGAVLGEPDGSPIRAAKACRRLGERVKHRLQIEGRAADDLEHSVDDDGADQLILLEHWHRQTRPSPGSVHRRDA